jgi:hypothetical protein
MRHDATGTFDRELVQQRMSPQIHRKCSHRDKFLGCCLLNENAEFTSLYRLDTRELINSYIQKVYGREKHTVWY